MCTGSSGGSVVAGAALTMGSGARETLDDWTSVAWTLATFPVPLMIVSVAVR